MNRIIAVIITGIACRCRRVRGTLGSGHGEVIQSPTEAKWGPAPPMLPPGAEIAVLSGDPGKSSAYAVRLKFPRELRASRPTRTRPTRTSSSRLGALTFGMGDKLVKDATNRTLSRRRLRVDAGEHESLRLRRGWRRDDRASTVRGRFEFKHCVNPSDDPRNKKK